MLLLLLFFFFLSQDLGVPILFYVTDIGKELDSLSKFNENILGVLLCIQCVSKKSVSLYD